MNKNVLGWVLAVIAGVVLGAAALAAMVHFWPSRFGTYSSMMAYNQYQQNNGGFQGFGPFSNGRNPDYRDGRFSSQGQGNDQNNGRQNSPNQFNPGGNDNRPGDNFGKDGNGFSYNCFGPSQSGRRGMMGWLQGLRSRGKNDRRGRNFGPGGMMQNFNQWGPRGMGPNANRDQNFGPGGMMQNFNQWGPGGMGPNANRDQNTGPGGMMQNNGVNPGGGMMNWGWYSQDQTNQPNQTRLTIDQALEKAKAAVESVDKNTTVSEIMEFTNNFYVMAKDRLSGKPAYELLVNVYTGFVSPEPGPNLMWNQKYGHMGSGKDVDNAITMEQAAAAAQKYLDSNVTGAKLEEKGASFPGYYTFDYRINDKVAGMISIHGSNGSAWLHTWHGQFIQEKEISQ